MVHLAVSALLGLATMTGACGHEPDENEYSEHEVSKPCRIGTNTVPNVSSTTKDCKDATTLTKIIGNLGKPLFTSRYEQLHEGAGLLVVNFQAAGSNTTYSSALQIDGNGGTFLSVDDLVAGQRVLDHNTFLSGGANRDYFASRSIEQTGRLINSFSESVLRRIHGPVGRAVGGAGGSSTSCGADCANRFCRFTSGIASHVTLARLPSLGMAGADAVGRALLDSCVRRGPTVVAKGTYCCQDLFVTGNKDGKKTYKGKGCVQIESGDKDGNRCSASGGKRVDCVGEVFSGGEIEDCTAS